MSGAPKLTNTALIIWAKFLNLSGPRSQVTRFSGFRNPMWKLSGFPPLRDTDLLKAHNSSLTCLDSALFTDGAALFKEIHARNKRDDSHYICGLCLSLSPDYAFDSRHRVVSTLLCLEKRCAGKGEGIYVYEPTAGSWFHSSFAEMVYGYAQLALPRSMSPEESIWGLSILFVLKGIALLVPTSYLSVPNLIKGAPAATLISSSIVGKSNKKEDDKSADEKHSSTSSSSSSKGQQLPVVVFSHGLTGTAEEHTLMFSEIARAGYIVAACHHEDGSSSRVIKENGKAAYFDTPDYANGVSTDFRANQESASDIQELMDTTKVILAGFSYGAATAALESVTNKEQYLAVVLWDGWYHVDLRYLETRGIKLNGRSRFDFPEKAHKDGIQHPALFIGSTQFAAWPPLAEATSQLIATASEKKAIVLDSSTHEQ
eukprot:jgi/Bigna1/132597/aug1.18_g7305